MLVAPHLFFVWIAFNASGDWRQIMIGHEKPKNERSCAGSKNRTCKMATTPTISASQGILEKQ